MLGKHKFRVGQRVRPSPEGIAALIFPKTRHAASGRIVKVDRFNSPTVKWADRKLPVEYYAEFIEPDRRRKP